MAFTPYHNISGFTTVALVSPGDGINGVKSISIANTHATLGVVIDLYIGTTSISGSKKSAEVYYLMKGNYLQAGDYLILNHDNLIFNNKAKSDYGLFITLGDSTSTVDVLISKG